MTNRKRNKIINFRLTEKEKEEIAEKIRLSGMTNSDFLMAILREGKVVVVEDLRKVIAEIKKQGSNLHQGLRYAHESGGLNNEELRIAIEDCGVLYLKLNEIAKEISLGTKRKA